MLKIRFVNRKFCKNCDFFFLFAICHVNLIEGAKMIKKIDSSKYRKFRSSFLSWSAMKEKDRVDDEKEEEKEENIGD